MNGISFFHAVKLNRQRKWRRTKTRKILFKKIEKWTRASRKTRDESWVLNFAWAPVPKRGIHRYLVFTFVSFNFISVSFRPVTSSVVTSLPFGGAGSSHWMWSVKSKIACFQFHSLSINVQNVILISFGQSTAFYLSVSSIKRFSNTPNCVHRFPWAATNDTTYGIQHIICSIPRWQCFQRRLSSTKVVMYADFGQCVKHPMLIEFPVWLLVWLQPMMLLFNACGVWPLLFICVRGIDADAIGFLLVSRSLPKR